MGTPWCQGDLVEIELDSAWHEATVCAPSSERGQIRVQREDKEPQVCSNNHIRPRPTFTDQDSDFTASLAVGAVVEARLHSSGWQR